MPCAVGLAVLAEPIIRLLCAAYYGPESVSHSRADARVFWASPSSSTALVLLFNAIMQAHGDVTTPVINMLIGGIVKIVVNYILVGHARRSTSSARRSAPSSAT